MGSNFFCLGMGLWNSENEILKEAKNAENPIFRPKYVGFDRF